MIVCEYARGLKNNYVRIRELALPDERKYQYCIMKRGGITGLLPFEIRYIDSDAYMYYDITSRQNIQTLYSKKPLGRRWIVNFFVSMKKIKDETVRFLLDPSNLIWNPPYVYQDLKSGDLSFLYVPYLDEDNGMSEMMDFLVSRVDYSDDELVKCVYSIAEQYKTCGEAYLDEKVYMDLKPIEDSIESREQEDESYSEIKEDNTVMDSPSESERESDLEAMYLQAEKIGNEFRSGDTKVFRLKKGKKEKNEKVREEKGSGEKTARTGSIISFLNRFRLGQENSADAYDFGLGEENMATAAEETVYSDAETKEDTEGTVFVDISENDDIRRLETEMGKVIYELCDATCVIGKQADEADLVLDEKGISRMHARIFIKDDEYYLEDLNSTNGTYKNGLKLQPYEQKKLTKGDEIRLAGRKLIFS